MENKTFAKTAAVSNIDMGLRSYMMRVYNFMAGGLCVSALTALVVMNTSLIRLFFSFAPNGYPTGLSAFGWLAFLAPLIIVIAFNWVVNRGTAQQVQLTFWGFAAAMGISLTPVLLAYTGTSVARIFLITAATFGGMSLYGYVTKRDLTAMGSFMIMGLWGIIIASIVNIFMKSSGMSFALSILTVIVFTGLTAFDTQKIRQIYSAADDSETLTKKAIIGALSLYLDFINIFLALLRLFGDRR